MSAVPQSTTSPLATGVPLPPRTTWSGLASPPLNLASSATGKKSRFARSTMKPAGSGIAVFTSLLRLKHSNNSLGPLLGSAPSVVRRGLPSGPNSEAPAEQRRSDDRSDCCLEYTVPRQYRLCRRRFQPRQADGQVAAKRRQWRGQVYVGAGGGIGRFHPCDQLQRRANGRRVR